jgi:signal transduction histidine kinase
VPTQYGNLAVWGLVLVLTYVFSTFVFRIVEGLQVQALARSRDEALANVRKHSAARHAWIEFDTRTPGQLHLVIGDDGLGFDPTVSTGQAQKTFGLASMRERAESLGGQLAIESQPGRGTRIVVDVPLQEDAHASSRATFAPAAG